MSALATRPWSVTSTGPEEGPSDHFAVLDEACAGDTKPSMRLRSDDGTFGVRLRAMGQPRAWYLHLQGAPAELMRLASVRVSSETVGSRLRPTQSHMDELWGLQNRRRGELLFKRVTSALTIGERRELEVLDAIAEQRLMAIAQRSMSRLSDFPSPPSSIVNIVSPPPS